LCDVRLAAAKNAGEQHKGHGEICARKDSPGVRREEKDPERYILAGRNREHVKWRGFGKWMEQISYLSKKPLIQHMVFES